MNYVNRKQIIFKTEQEIIKFLESELGCKFEKLVNSTDNLCYLLFKKDNYIFYCDYQKRFTRYKRGQDKDNGFRLQTIIKAFNLEEIGRRAKPLNMKGSF